MQSTVSGSASQSDIAQLEHKTGEIRLHGPEGFEGMRRAGRLAA